MPISLTAQEQDQQLLHAYGVASHVLHGRVHDELLHTLPAICGAAVLSHAVLMYMAMTLYIFCVSLQ